VISMMSLFFRAVGIPLSFIPTKLAKIMSGSSVLDFESAWNASQARSKASQFVVRLIARRFGCGFSEILIIVIWHHFRLQESYPTMICIKWWPWIWTWTNSIWIVSHKSKKLIRTERSRTVE
jgi:hypothetical protein